MMVFLDNNLSHHLANGMRAFQEDVTHLIEHFPPDARDVDWLPVVARREWVLITRDERIRKNPAELAAIRDHGIGVFFLGGKGRSRCDLVQQLVRNWPRIKELSARTRRPFAVRIPPSGTKVDPLSL